MEYLVIMACLGGLVSLIAISKGRSGIFWFFFGVFFFLIALIAVVVVDPLERCPQCGEMIQKDSVACRKCGKQLKI